LELVSSTYYENIDPSYVILRLASNYKGKDDNGKSSIRSVYLPPPEAFYALNQMAAVALPESSSPSSSSSSSAAVVSPTSAASSLTRSSSLKKQESTSSKKLGSISEDVPPTSSSNNTTERGTLIRDSSISGGRNTVIDLIEENSRMSASSSTSGKYGIFDSIIKVMILPRTELENLTSKNFNVILETMNVHEIDIKDAIIYPEAGKSWFMVVCFTFFSYSSFSLFLVHS
jgi:hypothetical protein